MDTRFRRSTLVISAAVAAVLVSGGVAFAYWTTTGTGTAAATVGTSGTVSVAQDLPAPSGLFPGGPAGTINYTVTNATAGDLMVSNVAVTVSSTSAGAGCTAADFTVTPQWTAFQVLAGGTKAGTATIAMNNTGSNQDACKGATVNLAFAAS